MVVHQHALPHPLGNTVNICCEKSETWIRLWVPPNDQSVLEHLSSQLILQYSSSSFTHRPKAATIRLHCAIVTTVAVVVLIAPASTDSGYNSKLAAAAGYSSQFGEFIASALQAATAASLL